MADAVILKNIETKIIEFQSGSLKQNTLNLFSTLGYESSHQMDVFENTPDGFLEYLSDNNTTINQNQSYFNEWKSVDFCLQLTNQEFSLFESKVDNFDNIINSYLLFCIELNKNQYSNKILADITRALNRVFPKPVFILFKYGNSLTLSIINRRKHKKDSSKEVLEKITLIKDIDIIEPHRAHKEILFDLSLIELKRKFAIHSFDELHSAWQSVLNISELNKKFYREISNWYFWAREKVEFPNKPQQLINEKDEDYHERVLSFNSMNLIRLITRLIFVWFLKEKGLISDVLFSENNLKELLLFNDNNNSTYYKAILQNLFFATLNQEMNTELKPDNRKFRHEKQHYNITNLYRYKSYFKDHEKAIKIFAETPFLNGGLFDCLDKRVKNSEGEEEIIRIDGFSDRNDNPLLVPDELFFSKQFNIDLSKVYDSKNKNDKVRGIINILHNYKFTIAENTPVEEEVALDPELLGKVFENLLASYNPETGTTARKKTGSFYTPREIVNYMVDESLIAYIDSKLKYKNITTLDETKLRNLLSYSDEVLEFSSGETDTILEALDNAKILDPACGSGAFPMGILQKLVHILHKLDPKNKLWKQKQIDKATQIDDTKARDAAIDAIEEAFENNELDYGRKLYLIENCIYGVDIQPIAAQISKLRFFISLIVEQKASSKYNNFGIRPLPNLETKFVAANTLITLDKEKDQGNLFENSEVEKIKTELKKVRHSYFEARTPKTKEKYRNLDKELREKLAVILENEHYMDHANAKRVATWDPYDQNFSANFFEPEWMFGIKDGFDIVIGNPPYVRNYKGSLEKSFVKYLKNTYKSAFKKFDLYVIFMDKGIQLLKSEGNISYIVPDKWLSQPYGENIRNIILEKVKISYIMDLTNIKVFESATVDNVIFNFIKSINIDNTVKLIKCDNNFESNNFNIIFKEQNTLKKDSPYNLYIDKFDQIILNKISQNSHLLKNIFYINWGCRPTPQDIFISDTKINELYKPLIVGSNISRYDIAENYRWVLYSDEMENPMFKELFENKSILFKDVIGKGNLNAGINTKNYYSDFTVINAIKYSKLKNTRIKLPQDFIKYDYYSESFILSIVNSKLVSYYFNKKMRNGLHTLPNGVKNLPIPIITEPKQLPFEDLVNIILLKKEQNQNTAKEEIQIDIMVYKLYKLTYKEVKIIEPGFALSQEEYENFELEG